MTTTEETCCPVTAAHLPAPECPTGHPTRPCGRHFTVAVWDVPAASADEREGLLAMQHIATHNSSSRAALVWAQVIARYANSRRGDAAGKQAGRLALMPPDPQMPGRNAAVMAVRAALARDGAMLIDTIDAMMNLEPVDAVHGLGCLARTAACLTVKRPLDRRERVLHGLYGASTPWQAAGARVLPALVAASRLDGIDAVTDVLLRDLRPQDLEVALAIATQTLRPFVDTEDRRVYVETPDGARTIRWADTTTDGDRDGRELALCYAFRVAAARDRAELGEVFPADEPAGLVAGLALSGAVTLLGEIADDM